MNRLGLVLSVVLISLSTVAFAQSDARSSANKTAVAQPADKMDHSAAPQGAAKAAPTEAQKSFATIKSLAGEWEGPATVPEMKGTPHAVTPLHVSMRVTSRGNVLVHEFQEAGTPLDATKYDHPVTMLYLDADQLNLIHYCDAGNRPHMTGKMSPDGKTLEFDLVDVSGGNQRGHMHHAVFTFLDKDHHIEDWTYMLPGDKPMHAHLDLHRTGNAGTTSGK